LGVFYKTPASWSPTRTSCLYRRRVCVVPGKPAAFQYLLYSRTATHLGNGGGGRGETFPPFYLLPSSYIDTLCECVCVCLSLLPTFSSILYLVEKEKEPRCHHTQKGVYYSQRSRRRRELPTNSRRWAGQTVATGLEKKVHNTPTHTERVSAGGLLLCVCRYTSLVCFVIQSQSQSHKSVFFFNIRFCHCDFLLSKHLIKE
jgi:hypothetical protein